MPTYTDKELLGFLAGYLVLEAKGEPIVFVEWAEDLKLPGRQTDLLTVAYMATQNVARA